MCVSVLYLIRINLIVLREYQENKKLLYKLLEEDKTVSTSLAPLFIVNSQAM